VIVAGLALPVLQQACAGQNPEAGPALNGIATVIDGDGLYVGDVEVRLFGIDAPETGQYCRRADGSRWRCGQYATVALDRFVGGKPITCRVRTPDPYGRSVSTCAYMGQDLAAKQVRDGWALAYRRFSQIYVSDEDAARQAHSGVWAGKFEEPWEWRQHQRSQKGK
jgi:endonuclease YncB( thermonuclease family)